METRPQAAIYARISDDKAGAGLGVQRQREDCEKLAERIGADVALVLTDNDVSAYSGAKRPGYAQLLDAIKDGTINTVLAWHNDRLHRSPRELEDYIDATEQHGVATHFVTSGAVDLSTPTGRMVARQVGIMARYESEHRAERISRAHRQGAEQGKYRGGSSRIFGYNDDGMTLRTEEATAIRDAYQWVLEGRTHASIIREWHSRGLRSPKGNEFSHVTFKNVLLRPRNYGASIYKGQTVGVGQWETITDEATWRAVKDIITDPNRKRNHSNQGKYLLGGIMLCGKCLDAGERNTVRSGATNYKGATRRYYTCRKASHNSIRIEQADAFIEALVIERLTREDSELFTQPVDEVKAHDSELRAKALRLRKNELVDMLAGGELDRAQFGRAMDRVNDELAVLERSMSADAGGQLLGGLFTADDVAGAWSALEWSQKREVINALLEIAVMPAGKGYVRGFQPQRLRVTWRS